MSFEEPEYSWGLFLQQLWRKIGGDDFNDLWELRQFCAKPCAARADFEHATGEFKAALSHQERNEPGQIVPQTTRPFFLCAEFMDGFAARLAQRDHALVRIRREV